MLLQFLKDVLNNDFKRVKIKTHDNHLIKKA